jgi:hypothetical protein
MRTRTPFRYFGPISLMISAAAKNASYALCDLGRFYFKGEYGIVPNVACAFDFYRQAYEMSPDYMSASAATALMLLEGIGTVADEKRGAEILRRAISIFGRNRSNFDETACFREVMAARKLDGSLTAVLPNARIYLDWIAKLNVPVAANLLAHCGGPLPRHETRLELSLSRVLPKKVKNEVWSVQSPIIDRLGQKTTLGQVEMLPNRQWIAATEAGVPVGNTFGSRRAAVTALASALSCDVPYPSF